MTPIHDFTKSFPTHDQLKSLLTQFFDIPTCPPLLRQEQLDNLQQAWQQTAGQARQQIDADQAPMAFAECAYLALIHTMLRPPPPPSPDGESETLIVEMAEEKAAQASEALKRAYTIGDPAKRADQLLRWAYAFTGQPLQKIVLDALDAMLSSSDQGLSSSDQGPLDSRLPWHKFEPYCTPDWMPLILERLKSATQESALSGALEYFSRHMNPSQLEEAIEITLHLKDAWFRAWALNHVACEMKKPPKRVVQAQLHAAWAIGDPENRVWAFMFVLHDLKGKQKTAAAQAALEAVLSLPNGHWLYRNLPSIAHNATGDTLQKLIDAALALKSAKVLYEMWEYLSVDQQMQALDAALAIKDKQYKVEALVRLLDPNDRLDKSSLHDKRDLIVASALQAVNGIRSDSRREWALAELRPFLTEAEQEQGIIKRSRHYAKNRWHANALARLSQYMSSPEREQAAELALNTAFKEQYEDYFTEAVGQIAPDLPTTYLIQAFEALLDSPDGLSATWALTRLLPHLSEEQRQRGLQKCMENIEWVKRAWNDDFATVSICDSVLPFLEGDFRQYVIQLGLSAKWNDSNTWHYAHFLGHLTEAERIAKVRQIVASELNNYADEEDLFNVLWCLGKYLPDDLLPHALATAHRLQDRDKREEALCKLAARLANQQGLELALALESVYWRSDALAQIAQATTGELHETALQAGLKAAQAVKSPGVRAAYLAWYLEIVSESAELLRAIRHALLDYLWEERDSDAMLITFTHDRLFAPPVVPPDILGKVGHYLLNIGELP